VQQQPVFEKTGTVNPRSPTGQSHPTLITRASELVGTDTGYDNKQLSRMNQASNQPTNRLRLLFPNTQLCGRVVCWCCGVQSASSVTTGAVGGLGGVEAVESAAALGGGVVCELVSRGW
jgi:hypothetical protein